MAQIILLKDVPKVGQRGDVKEVSDGFFRHFLLPKKLAELATREKIKKHEEEQKARGKEKEKIEKKSSEEIGRLDGKVLTFLSKATDKGSLYKAISVKNIEEKLREGGFREVSENWIKMEKPLKEIGEVEIDIENPSGERAKLKIEIKPLEN